MTVRELARPARRAATWPWLLDHAAGRPGSLGVRLADGERMAGVGLVAVGDDDRRDADRGRARRATSNGRERGTRLQRVGDRLEVLVLRQALADDAHTRVAPRLGHAAGSP